MRGGSLRQRWVGDGLTGGKRQLQVAAAEVPHMETRDVLAATLAGAATFALLAGFDIVAAGGIDWLFDTGLAIVIGAVVLYFRITDPDDAKI